MTKRFEEGSKDMNDIIFLLDPTQEGVASTHTQEEAVRQIPLYGTEIFFFFFLNLRQLVSHAP